MAKKSAPKIIPPFIIGDPTHPWGGLNTAVQDTRFLDRGETYDSMNWITSKAKDNIQLRRGKALLGQTDRTGNAVSGLGIGIRDDGLQVPFFTYDRKIMFYDSADDDTEEVDTANILPLVASEEGMNIMPYTNLAGSFVYLTSPHSSIYKIAVANPGSVVDMQATDYRFGFAKINRSRMFGMARSGEAINSKDNTGLYLSHIDKQLITDYANSYMSLPKVLSAVSAAGGSLNAAQIYFVAVTAFGPKGSETTIGPTVAGVKIAGGQGSINVSWPNVAGASKYNIYLTDKALIQLTSHVGIFTVGETVTGATSGATGKVVDYDNNLNLVVDTLHVANFAHGETITGGSSGATGVVNTEAGEFLVAFVAQTLATLGGVIPASGALNVQNVSTVFTANPPTTTTQQLIAYIGTGDGATKTFSGTLPTIPAENTAFFVSMTDGIELFLDNKSGGLVGSLGGTGTINYATGAYSITFNTAPINTYPISVSYYLENSNDQGITYFTPDVGDTHNAAGQIFRQDEGGGKAQAVWPYQGVEYCFHLLRSWLFNLTVTGQDTAFNNEPYYEQIGIPSRLGAFPTGDGVLFVNLANQTNPNLSILTIPQASTNLTVVPEDLSNEKLDLSGFNFDRAVVFRADVYDILCCAKYTNGILDTYNSRTFIRQKDTGIWNLLDYTISALAQYTNGLLSGDSLSPNLFQLFSGFDDEGNIIDNHWNNAYTDLELDGLKKVGYFNIQGLIQSGQKVKVSYSLDDAPYVDVFTIDGDGAYVNKSSPVGIGTFAIGANLIGGGGTVNANSFEIDIPVHTDLFQYISFRLEAIDIGYVQIDKFQYKDIRFKRRRIISFNDPELNDPSN